MVVPQDFKSDFHCLVRKQKKGAAVAAPFFYFVTVFGLTLSKINTSESRLTLYKLLLFMHSKIFLG